MKEIKNLHENFIAQILIKNHKGGGMGIRDESDFINVKFHCRITLDLMKDLLLNFNGTNEERLDLIERTKIDLEKFKIK